MKIKLPIYLTEIEAAEILNVHRQTMTSWRYRGVGPPFVRLSPACIRYRRQDLDEWLEARKVTPEPRMKVETI